MQITIRLEAGQELLNALTKIAAALSVSAPVTSAESANATSFVPTTPENKKAQEPALTYEEVRALANALLDKGKGKAVKALLNKVGKSAITDIPQPELPLFFEALKAV